MCKDFPEYHTLRKAYLTKAIIAGTLIILAIAFTVCLFSHQPGALDAGGKLVLLIK
jgi:hypothetical protein